MATILNVSRPAEFQNPWYQEIETVWDEIEATVNCNVDRLVNLENQPRLIKVDMYDPVSTTLPSGTSATIDGETLANGDLVLFSNLSSDNNRVYQASGVGSSIVWTEVEVFGPGDSLQATPLDADTARIQRGDFFQDQLAVYNGTDWKVNDIIRLFNGTDFWEMSSLQSLTINANSTNNIFTVTAAGSEHFALHYSISRGTAHETGILLISHDGTDVALATSAAGENATGVTFSGQINAGDLEIDYTADNSLGNGTLKFWSARWGDAAGGPIGLPDYSNAGGSSVAAAGNDDEIQYNSSNSLAADSRFKWVSSEGALGLDGLNIHSLSSALTILDNQAAPTTLFSYDAATNKYAVIEYSIERGSDDQVGTLYVVNNGVSVSITNQFTNTSSVGVTFSASLSAGNVNIEYVSTSTGQTGELRHSTRRWTN